MPSWVSQRDQKDKQNASHNRLPPYSSCGSRLRHWLHSPQKVPTCGTGFLASTLFPLQHVALIQPSAWKGNSAKFALQGPTAQAKHISKNTAFRRCAVPPYGSKIQL